MGGTGDTSIGGAGRDFPSTCWSLIRGARDRKDPAYLGAVNELCRLYWKPVYAYVRAARGLNNEEAKDLTQEFLLDLVEGGLLTRYQPDKGNFRSYLRGTLHLFLLEQHRNATALKRGGGRALVSISPEETDLVDRLVAGAGATADGVFERQWANSVLDLAVGDLRRSLEAEGKADHYKLFERHQLAPAGPPPSHAELAEEFGIKDTDVNNRLAACRKQLRDLVTARIREYVSEESELKEELGRLFGR